MHIRYEQDLGGEAAYDEAGRLRHALLREPTDKEHQEFGLAGAVGLVQRLAGRLQIPPERLEGMHEKVSFFEPRDEAPAFRLSEQKQLFDTTTFGFYQTELNVPVWRAGVSVTVKDNDQRAISIDNMTQADVGARMPAQRPIEKWRGAIAQSVSMSGPEALRASLAGQRQRAHQDHPTAGLIRSLVGAEDKRAGIDDDGAKLIRARFYVYRYDASQRSPDGEAEGGTRAGAGRRRRKRDETRELHPMLPLPPVPDGIENGKGYLVVEITFTYATREWGRHNWLALVEVETNAVLYLRALVANVDGRVFPIDPVSASGDATKSPSKDIATLNPYREWRTLQRLNAPTGGNQALRGSWASVQNVEDPAIAAPTRPTGSNFDYDCRTNDFAAVNAYYHTDRVFEVIESLGFTISSYFNGTSFPVEIDHRGLGGTGNEINAHCSGNGAGGIDHCCYGLNDLSDTGNPIGRACDSRVHWHELGGHGILYEHVDTANFGFAHSAGDSLAMIHHDPDSKAPDRFRYVPFHPTLDRRANRIVADGWGWGGVKDTGGYPSEEILTTTLFRVYQSIGGDAADHGRRRFAADFMMYLILRAVGTLTPGTNPSNASGFANAMLTADLGNWTSRGLYGGAYGKVIRWSFERQGLYRAAGDPNTAPGRPPPVDVYIDDGRGGEYGYQPVHWQTTTVWNRRAADGGTAHEEPQLGVSNYVYARVKNRGTQTANNVRVRGYHCLPSAGLIWPGDFQAMTTPEIAAGTLAPNSSEEKIVGPFEWTPNTNAYGHDCLLMVSVADGDAPNTDNFTAGENVAEWRLVPNDNNIAQRNVYPVPGGGGMEALKSALQHVRLWVGNPNPHPATVTVEVKLPAVLEQRGWRIHCSGLTDGGERLRFGEKREVRLHVELGADFARIDVPRGESHDIDVVVRADGSVVGGMTYRIDPERRRSASPGQPPPGLKGLVDVADGDCRSLLDALVSRSCRIRKARLKKLVIELDVEDDDQC